MKVSLALHSREPDQFGNQRTGEVKYGGYNRAYGDLVVDPNTGAGTLEVHNLQFPMMNTDSETARWFSVARCFAPEGWGGAVIIAGPLQPEMHITPGSIPVIGLIGAAVEPARMKELALVVQEPTGAWREKSEAELRATMDGVR